MAGRSYSNYIGRAKAVWGERFSAAGLEQQFVRYFESGERIKVRFDWDTTGEHIITGTVGVTTGWSPVFLLMRTRRSVGSSDLLDSRARIVGVQRGHIYYPVAA